MSATVRQKKMGRLVQKELSEILRFDKREILQREFVGITEVQMSPDLGMAKVYINMTLAKDKQAMLERINMNKGEVRKMLGMRIRKQVRRVPQLVFFADEAEENAQRIDALLDKLDIPPYDEGTDQ